MTDLKHEISTYVEAPTKPGLHILVVEHQRLHQRQLQEQLELIGCVITLAQNANEALQRWDNSSHDLLLIAVNLPDQNGYQLAHALRNQGCKTPIIGIINQLEERPLCLQAGMNAVLIHPLHPTDLQSLLNRLVSTPIPKRYRAIFQQTMSADLALLEQALHDKNDDTAQLVLHRMAGALVVMGIQDMAEAMHQLKDQFNQNANGHNTARSHAIALCTALRDLIDKT